MVYGCSNSVIKFLVFSLSLLICLSGGLIMGVSLWANWDNNFSYHISNFIDAVHLSDELKDLGNYQASLWVLVVVGGLLFLVGFLGCCGAAREDTFLLSLFFVIVLILAAIELGAAIFAAVNKDEFRIQLTKILEKGADTEKGRDQLKPIEDAFICCGTPNHRDGSGKCTPEEINGGDCITKILNGIESGGLVAIIIMSVVLVMELLSLIFSCVLCRAFRERSPSYHPLP